MHRETQQKRRLSRQMEQVYDLTENCYGCGACVNICPRDTIHMEPNEEGFLYPVIDEAECIDCGKCKKVCPIYTDIRVEKAEQSYFAVKHKDMDVIENSSSGGVFTALADAVRDKGGIIYGVLMDEKFSVVHRRTSTKEECDLLRGSKYVQSDMNTVMQQMEADLKEDRYVMFTGTPCQVAGVKNFLIEKRLLSEKVLLCDFICHGVASPGVWKSYVDYFAEKYNTGLQKYFFRGKKQGWHQCYPVIYANNQELSEGYRDKESFLLLYQTCYINRKSCYSCKYTSYDREADITFGDFWNIQSVNPQMDDNKGTSQVLINSEKGRKWLKACGEAIYSKECTKEDVWQPHLEYPNAIPKKRETFWMEYRKKNFKDIIVKYGQGDWLVKAKRRLTPILKRTGLYVLMGKVYKMLFVGKGKKHAE